MIAPLVCDLTGRTQTWLWLLHTFGRVEYHAATPRRGHPLYRITRLCAGVTGQLLTSTVLDEQGRRLPRIRVVRAWSLTSDSLHEQCAVNPWLGDEDFLLGVEDPRRSLHGDLLGNYVAMTDDEGLAEFPAGSDDLYSLPARGRSILWIAGARSSPAGDVIPSDAVSGIGILQSTLGLRLCVHVTWKRMWGPASRAFPPGATP